MNWWEPQAWTRLRNLFAVIGFVLSSALITYGIIYSQQREMQQADIDALDACIAEVRPRVQEWMSWARRLPDLRREIRSTEADLAARSPRALERRQKRRFNHWTAMPRREHCYSEPEHATVWLWPLADTVNAARDTMEKLWAEERRLEPIVAEIDDLELLRLEVLKLAAAAKETDAMLELASLYRDGHPPYLTKNPARAIQLTKRAQVLIRFPGSGGGGGSEK